jgi:hypothetical protein
MIFRQGYAKSMFLKRGNPIILTWTGVHVHPIPLTWIDFYVHNSLSQQVELQLNPLHTPSWHTKNQLYLLLEPIF